MFAAEHAASSRGKSVEPVQQVFSKVALRQVRPLSWLGGRAMSEMIERVASALSQAEARRRWLAKRIWGGDLIGLKLPIGLNRADKATLSYWLKRGHVEEEDGMFRLTDAGRASLSLEDGE
jgi:hypothetical protein